MAFLYYEERIRSALKFKLKLRLTCKFMCSDYSLLCTVKSRDQQQIYMFLLKHCSIVRMSENRPRPMRRKTSEKGG